MAEPRVQILGPFAALCDGRRVRLRTRPQALLLARLAVGPVSRDEAAGLLWPDALHPQALAYLRRARQELRSQGFEILTDNGVLRLSPEIVTDFDAARQSGALAPTLPVLAGFDGEAADEIRRLVDHEARRAAGRRTEYREDDAYTLVGRLLVREEPDATATHLIAHWDRIKHRSHPASLYDLLAELLDALPTGDTRRGALLNHAGWNAYLVTRYGRARRLLGEALAAAERTGDSVLEALTLANLTTVEMSEGRWATGRAYADRAVAAALRSGDPVRHARALFNSASLNWQTLDFDRAVAEYRASFRASPAFAADPEGVRTLRANLACLAFGHGVETGPLPPAPETPAADRGYSAYMQASGDFWVAFGNDVRAALGPASRLLEICGVEGMEYQFARALEGAGCLFGRLGLSPEAAACVRLGSRLRRQLGGRLSPADRHLLRRHAPGPYFGPEAARLAAAWGDDELPPMARRIAVRLRSLAASDVPRPGAEGRA